MLRVCQFCGAEYEGAAQSRFCSNAHRVAFSRKGKVVQNGEAAQVEPEQTAPRVEPVQKRSRTLRGLIADARAGTITLTEKEEQAIRNHYGYGPSEKRTLLQRDAVVQEPAGKLSWRPTSLAEVPPEWYDPDYVEAHFDEVDFSAVIEHVFLSDLPGPLLARLAIAGRLQPLTLSAFPVRTPGDLAPTPEERGRLG